MYACFSFSRLFESWGLFVSSHLFGLWCMFCCQVFIWIIIISRVVCVLSGVYLNPIAQQKVSDLLDNVSISADEELAALLATFSQAGEARAAQRTSLITILHLFYNLFD